MYATQIVTSFTRTVKADDQVLAKFGRKTLVNRVEEAYPRPLVEEYGGLILRSPDPLTYEEFEWLTSDEVRQHLGEVEPVASDGKQILFLSRKEFMRFVTDYDLKEDLVRDRGTLMRVYAMLKRPQVLEELRFDVSAMQRFGKHNYDGVGLCTTGLAKEVFDEVWKENRKINGILQVTAKGIVNGRRTKRLTKGLVHEPVVSPWGEPQACGVSRDFEFKKVDEDVEELHIYPLRALGQRAMRASEHLLSILVTDERPELFIERENDWLEKQTFLSFLSTENRRKYKAGLPLSLLDSSEHVLNLMFKYRWLGHTATAIPDTRVPEGQCWLLPGSVRQLEKYGELDLGAMLPVKRDPPRPDKSGTDVLQFGGEATMEGAEFGIIVNPHDVICKRLQLDFDGDGLVIGHWRNDRLKYFGRRMEDVDANKYVLDVGEPMLRTSKGQLWLLGTIKAELAGEFHSVGFITMLGMYLAEVGLLDDHYRKELTEILQAAISSVKKSILHKMVQKVLRSIQQDVKAVEPEAGFLTKLLNELKHTSKDLRSDFAKQELQKKLDDIQTWIELVEVKDMTPVQRVLARRFRIMMRLHREMEAERSAEECEIPPHFKKVAIAKSTEAERQKVYAMSKQYGQVVGKWQKKVAEGADKYALQALTKQMNDITNDLELMVRLGSISEAAVVARGNKRWAAQLVSADWYEKNAQDTRPIDVEAMGDDLFAWGQDGFEDEEVIS